MRSIIGVDEVGRGPLAGPVIACAVNFPSHLRIPTLRDSKRLSQKAREKLVPVIESKSAGIGFGRAEVAEIDSINILQASLNAMDRALFDLGIIDNHSAVYIDGNQVPKRFLNQAFSIICGDQLIPAIMAASVLAKVKRDKEMMFLDSLYPGYGFKRNKGYPTKFHLDAISTLGPCPIHRLTFKPVQASLGLQGE